MIRFIFGIIGWIILLTLVMAATAIAGFLANVILTFVSDELISRYP